MDLSNYDFSQFSLAKLADWELELIRKYPLIYLEPEESNIPYYMKSGDKNFDPDDFCNLRHGFEFNRGWAKLADDFSRIASELVTHLRATTQPDAYIHAGIFKEKFGGLRWQGCNNLIGPFRTLFNAYTRTVEEQSFHVCEISGTRGKLRDIDGWAITLCDTEYIKVCEKRGVKPTANEGDENV